MNSKERMLAAINCEDTDHIPCSFMLFHNMRNRSADETEFVEKQLELGLDACVHVGRLKHSFHPEVNYNEWVETDAAGKVFCRRLDTPAGPLTGRVRQRNGWPQEGNFPIFNDWIVGRAEEILVKPEEDLEKLKYLFGPFTDEAIGELQERAARAKALADKHALLQVGGWTSFTDHSMDVEQRGNADGGVMGADAMAWLSGYEEVMILSLTNPDIIRQYAQIIHEWNLKQIEIYLDVTDADIIWRRAWYETTEFWTPNAYRDILLPPLKKEVELVHQAGRKYGYIITSAFLPVLDCILESDIDVLIGLDPEEGKGTDLNLVKDAFLAQKKAIWGGVSGAITVELGTPAQTEEAVQHAIEVLGEGSGFILSPVDNVREDTENAWQNTHAFINAWKKYRGDQ